MDAKWNLLGLALVGEMPALWWGKVFTVFVIYSAFPLGVAMNLLPVP
jgi:hypothetical protein